MGPPTSGGYHGFPHHTPPRAPTSRCYSAYMRTTLEIDDDVMQAAREIAQLKKQGIGRALSDLARRGLVPEAAPKVEMRDGIPVWVHSPGALAVTSHMVRSLAEEE